MLTEGIAMKTLFSKVPAFSSTKSFTGHCLGAAGSIEAVFSLLAVQRNLLLPNLNFNNSILEHGLEPQLKAVSEVPITNVLSNSSGMGGFCSSIVMSKA